MAAKKQWPHQCGANKVHDGGLFGFGGDVSIGIDQSYSGFAITALLEDNEHFYTWLYKSKGSGVDRLLLIETFIRGVLNELSDCHFFIAGSAIEGYAFGSQMANMLGELGYAVKRTLRNHLVIEASYPWVVPPTSLKKYVTGKGNAGKNEMLLAIYKNWSVEFTDDNMADSFGLAYMTRGFTKYAYQKEVLTKLAELDKNGGFKNRECP